jgi:hypothetical protein
VAGRPARHTSDREEGCGTHANAASDTLSITAPTASGAGAAVLSLSLPFYEQAEGTIYEAAPSQ